MQRRHHGIWSAPGGLPVYRQVYQRIRSEILSGRLAAGPRLPSSRTLASELGIARGTVVTAFQMLAGEGYTVSAGARGTVVNVALSRAGKSKPSAEPAETGGKIRRSISTLPTPLLFRVGLPALDAFPRTPDPVTIATEGALWGSVKAHGFLPNTVIVTDDAGQFNVGRHGLCWGSCRVPRSQARHLHA